VQNYISAVNTAIERLKELPLSTRTLKETHRTLLQDVRGENKTPGEYRTSQNWIGGATLNDAVFVPPHHSEVNVLMGDLENFLHNPNIDVPRLIRIAIAHYQFETIHPFLDGNGRVGRLLITLYLVSEGLLSKPTLYLSDHLERHKTLYYDNLMLVRARNDIGQCVKFMLTAMMETCDKGIETFRKILELKEEIEGSRLPTLGRKTKVAKSLLNDLYSNPATDVARVKEILNLSQASANSLVADFERLGILEEITGFKRNRYFMFSEYVNLFR
jgi:Fic family protein